MVMLPQLVEFSDVDYHLALTRAHHGLKMPVCSEPVGTRFTNISTA
jgi:hypothetical protein